MKRPAAAKKAASKRPAKRCKEEEKLSMEKEGGILFESDEEPSKQKADTTDAEDEELLLASDDDGEGTGQQSQTTERTLRKLPFNHVPNVSDFVKVFLHEHSFRPLKEKLAATFRSIGTLRVGSMCSGWGVLEMVMECLQHEWNLLEDDKSALKVSLEFMVEIDKRKQEYLRTRFPSARWVFDDMKEMGKKSAKTWDGSEQTIPEVDLFVAGFPCVSISTLTVTPGSVMDPACQSGCGFRAVEQYARKRRPPLILLENVASLFHKRKVEGSEVSGYDRVWTSLTKLGYLVTALGCNTADYGLPQQRSRAWLMCVLKDQTCPNAEFLMPEALKLFRCQPLPLDVLLSTQVLEKQDSRTSNKPSRRETQPKWKDALIQVYDQLGKANVEATIAKLRGNTGCGSDREVAILAAAVEEIRQTKQIDPFKETLVIQVDQNFGRQTYPKSNLRTTSCVIPGGKYICTGEMKFRCLTDKERASLQGVGPMDWAHYKMGEVPSSTMRSFIGNAFSVPVHLGALVSLLAHWEPAEAADV